MKKTISLLAVALFATVFAAGCGGHKDCDDANKGKTTTADKKAECTKDKFADAKFEGICWFNDTADKCDKLPAYDKNAQTADKTACEAVNAPTAATECDKISANGKAWDAKCEYTAGNPCKYTAAPHAKQ